MENHAKNLASHRPEPVVPKKLFFFGFFNMDMLDKNGIDDEWIGTITPWGGLFKNYQSFDILSFDSDFSLSFIKKWDKENEDTINCNVKVIIDVDFNVDFSLHLYF